MELDRRALEEWARDKPLSILQLDPADRAVLKIAGKRGRFGRIIAKRREYNSLGASSSKYGVL